MGFKLPEGGRATNNTGIFVSGLRCIAVFQLVGERGMFGGSEGPGYRLTQYVKLVVRNEIGGAMFICGGPLSHRIGAPSPRVLELGEGQRELGIEGGVPPLGFPSCLQRRPGSPHKLRGGGR